MECFIAWVTNHQKFQTQKRLLSRWVPWCVDSYIPSPEYRADISTVLIQFGDPAGHKETHGAFKGPGRLPLCKEKAQKSRFGTLPVSFEYSSSIV
jgi:hypothetical protein